MGQASSRALWLFDMSHHTLYFTRTPSRCRVWHLHPTPFFTRLTEIYTSSWANWNQNSMKHRQEYMLLQWLCNYYFYFKNTAQSLTPGRQCVCVWSHVTGNEKGLQNLLYSFYLYLFTRLWRLVSTCLFEQRL